MKKVPGELLDFLRTGNKFLVTGHKEEDGDCVGSQLALCSALRRLGKEAIPCATGPFKRTEIKPYEKFFCFNIDEKTRKDAFLIIADCCELERTGDLAPVLKGLHTAFIDHHKINLHKQDLEGKPIYICEESPSVTLMILNIIDALGMELTKEEAEYLLFGLCTDTGFFRHVDSGNAETFEAAAKLVKAGASPKKTYRDIYGNKSLDSRYLLGHILIRTESHFGGKLLVTTEDAEKIQQYGTDSRDSDTLYQLLQSVTGAQAVVLIRQDKPGKLSVGFRSLDPVDVSKIAESLGGGGHKNAAGASITGTIDEIIPKIPELFKNIFS